MSLFTSCNKQVLIDGEDFGQMRSDLAAAMTARALNTTPDLLAALKEAVETWEDDSFSTAWVHKARRVIALAEGGEG